MMDSALIATDSLDLFELFAAEIGALGYDPVWVENGQELIDAVAARCPAFVFIDTALPVISAHACCSELRKDRTVPAELPIFLLTDDEVNPFAVAKAGFSDTFPKKHDFFALREFLAQQVWK